jgi:hypothetical protein
VLAGIQIVKWVPMVAPGYQCCVSGILCFFDPGIRDVKKITIWDPGSETRNKNPGSYFQKLSKNFLVYNTVEGQFKFFVADPYPGCGTFLTLDPGWKNSDPGSGSTSRNRNTASYYPYLNTK